MGNNQESDTHVSGQTNKPLSMPSHDLSYHAVLDELAANAYDGLAIAEFNARFEEYGHNELDGWLNRHTVRQDPGSPGRQRLFAS